jgi:isopenicillin N synthase-like dioxygenase
MIPERIFNFGEFRDLKATQPIPSTLTSTHEASLATFWDACLTLCLRIVTLLGHSLQVDPPSYFAEAHRPSHGPSGNTLRLLHYPPVAPGTDTAGGIRAGAHSDYGSVTLLFRLPGQPGLEVLDRTDTWRAVPVLPPGTEHDAAPPILVNIGDLLSYWTNGLLRSTVHRVVLPPGGGAEEDGARHSVAFFCHPAGNARLEAVPSEVVRAHVPAGGEIRGKREEVNPYLDRKVLTADEHLQMRLRASYLSLYKEENEAQEAAS